MRIEILTHLLAYDMGKKPEYPPNNYELTGLAGITGRGELTWEHRMVRHGINEQSNGGCVTI
jgi:hypothetical protein